jgi:hypothetical protein
MIKSTLLTSLVISAALPCIAHTAETILHEENFQNVSVQVGPTGSEWKPGKTIPGFYAVIGALEMNGTPKHLALNQNGERGTSTLLYLFEKGDNKSLGFSVGYSTGTAILALRLENHSDQPIKEINLSFDIHQWTATSTKPKVVKLSFTEGDPLSMDAGEVSHFLSSKEESIKWTDIPEGEVVTPLHNGEGLVNPLKEGLIRKSVKLSFLNWPPNTALWIRWNLSGSPWGKMSLSNVRVTTPKTP